MSLAATTQSAEQTLTLKGELWPQEGDHRKTLEMVLEGNYSEIDFSDVTITAKSSVEFAAFAAKLNQQLEKSVSLRIPAGTGLHTRLSETMFLWAMSGFKNIVVIQKTRS